MNLFEQEFDIRQFYRELLSDLPNLTGIKNHLEKSNKDNLRKLIDWMVDESNSYKGRIPLKKQGEIIRKAVVDDPNFTGLNISKVRQYLNTYWEQNKHTVNRDISQAHKKLSVEDIKQTEHFKKLLEEKKRDNPDYDPIEEFKKNMKKSQEKFKGEYTGRFSRLFGKSLLPDYNKNK